MATSDRNTQLQVELDELRIRDKDVISAFTKVKLDIDTEQQQRRFRIDNTRRELRVTEAQLRYAGNLSAKRDGSILDLQVIKGQTVKPGQRLGTIGARSTTAQTSATGLRAIAYFRPADARRLQSGQGIEVVPDWQQRGRFGGSRAWCSGSACCPPPPKTSTPRWAIRRWPSRWWPVVR